MKHKDQDDNPAFGARSAEDMKMCPECGIKHTVAYNCPGKPK